jgi:hypothetical protein
MYGELGAADSRLLLVFNGRDRRRRRRHLMNVPATST